jgi:hypothetical protein
MYATKECHWAMLTAYMGDDMAELVKRGTEKFLSHILHCWKEWYWKNQMWKTRDTHLN